MLIEQRVKVFLQVAHLQGFRRAARVLGISQSAVSFHIDRLEEELGVKLFYRRGRTIELTSEGEALFNVLEPLKKEADRVEAEFANIAPTLARRVRVGSNAIACPFVLPFVIQKFKHKHPQVTFSYKHADHEDELVAMLLDGDIDLVIVGHDLRHSKLARHLCYTSDLVLVASPEMDKLPQMTLQPKDLIDIPMVFESSDRGMELLLTQAMSDLGVRLSDLSIFIESDNLALIKSFVMAGVAAAFLPHITVKDELELGKMRTIDIEGFEVKQPIYLHYTKVEHHNPHVRAFAAFVHSQVADIVESMA